MIKCAASGSRLELEFIVTGSARFKVSAAALGFSTSSTEPASSMPAAAPAAAAASSTTAAGAARSASAAVASVDEQEEWQSGAPEPAGMAGRRCLSASEALVDVGTATWGGCSSTGDEPAADTAADNQQQQQHQQQGLELGSTPSPVNSSSFMQWRSLRRSSAGGGGSLGRSSSYMRSLGSSVVEGALRSRLVKTDDGEYWVNVEAFTLQFR
jgi:pyruvate/2-oxoglutarate dehydrogenase complex dihydrolipoamide acyltransferase (E2) component